MKMKDIILNNIDCFTVLFIMIYTLYLAEKAYQ